MLDSQMSLWIKYNTTHLLNCKKGGFFTIRHNNIKDQKANFLVKIYADVETKPFLQSIERDIKNNRNENIIIKL